MREKGQPRPGRSRAGSALAELAEKQYGVVSIRQLSGPLGYSESAVGRAVAAGRLIPIYRGVYAVGHGYLPPHGKHLAAVLACGPGSLLSYRSAAWLWGLIRYEPRPFDVTAVGPRRHSPAGIRVHRARHLTDADRTLLRSEEHTSEL